MVRHLDVKWSQIRIIGLGFISLLFFYAVYPAMDIPFILDDHSKIELNQDIKSLSGMMDKLVYPYGSSPISTRNDPSRPLIYFLYTVIYAQWGATPGPFHGVNIILHGINGILVISLLREMLVRLGRQKESSILALIGGGFFLLAPINVMTAAYIYGLSDVLSLTLMLLALKAHAKREERPIGATLLITTSTLLALSAKQIAVLTPCLMLLYDWLLKPELFSKDRHRVWQRYAASLVPVLIYLVARYMYLGGLGDLEGKSNVKPLAFYLLAQPHAILHYLTASFVPRGLCLDHDLPDPTSELGLHLFKCFLFLGLAFVWAAVLLRKRTDLRARLALAGGLFFLAWLAPTSSFFPTVDYVVERRVYGGVLGLAMMLIAGLLWGWDRIGGGQKSEMERPPGTFGLWWSLCGPVSPCAFGDAG